jgi:hypothetical protein
MGCRFLWVLSFGRKLLLHFRHSPHPCGLPCKGKYRGCRADKSAGLPICMRSTRRANHMDVIRETQH